MENWASAWKHVGVSFWVTKAASMQFIDLSIPITNDVISDPPVMRPQITYMTHENTWAQIAMFFPGLQKEDLPDGEG